MTLAVLSIAGSDPSGGAGVQADLKTFAALGVYGMAAITALTAQNTTGVYGVHAVPAAFVAAQIARVFEDIPARAVKLGMMANADIVHAVADALEQAGAGQVVLDPVMIATSGHALLDPDAVAALRARLLPLACVITPNLPEAAALLGCKAITDRGAMADAASALLALGAQAVLLKGGHLPGGDCPDLLMTPAGLHWLPGPRLTTRNTHGTGCTLSSALAALLAKQPQDLLAAARAAKDYVAGAIAHADATLGRGAGPLAHGWQTAPTVRTV
jgi:hydroxymethylpyrimidine/phosphomethylpyrimidine kinase